MDAKTAATARDLDKPGAEAGQDGLPWAIGSAKRGRLRLRTLVTLRWLAIVGQSVTLLFVGYGLGLPAPYALCFTVVALSAWVNILIMLTSSGQRIVEDWEASLQIAFDILQLTILLYLTGGVINPFSLLIIAPVVLAAVSLPLRNVLALGALAIACTGVISTWSLPLPSPTSIPFEPPLLNRIGAVIARVLGICFTAAYAWQSATEAARMELALDTTNAVLAREQRLSALGGLAAAAAHELGTPLATITVVAKEMARNAPPGDMKEDADLLVAQAERCREILRRLTETPEKTDVVHERLTLLQFVQEAIEAHSHEDVRVEAVVSGPPGEPAPEIWRIPEVLHAMTSFVENAMDFARSEVLVTARFDARYVSVEVRDDGPGFAPEVLTKLGEPYVTSRPGAEGSRSGHVGMGLGFFIAKTLLERTGATVDFKNGRRGGAIVSARWPRRAIEAPPAPDPFAGLDAEDA
ncbi:MAG TPA: ActS/PrrB/RegB family redox-sensitive histidine kinase [Caulobacteraceae bacterium]